MSIRKNGFQTSDAGRDLSGGKDIRSAEKSRVSEDDKLGTRDISGSTREGDEGRSDEALDNSLELDEDEQENII